MGALCTLAPQPALAPSLHRLPGSVPPQPARLAAARAWDPGSLPPPQCSEAGAGAPEERGGPSGIAKGISRGGGCWGDLEVRFWGVKSRITADNRGVWVPLSCSLSSSPPPSVSVLPPPDTVPVLGPGHQPNPPHHGLVDRAARERGRLGPRISRIPVSGQHGRQISFPRGCGQWGWGGVRGGDRFQLSASAACCPHRDEELWLLSSLPGLLGSTQEGRTITWQPQKAS